MQRRGAPAAAVRSLSLLWGAAPHFKFCIFLHENCIEFWSSRWGGEISVLVLAKMDKIPRSRLFECHIPRILKSGLLTVGQAKNISPGKQFMHGLARRSKSRLLEFLSTESGCSRKTVGLWRECWG